MFSPDRIELLDSVHFGGPLVQVNITNLSENTIEYSFIHEAAESATSYNGGNTYPLTQPILGNDKATVEFSQTTIAVPAGHSATITIRFGEPSTGEASNFPFYSGFIVANPDNNGVPVRIPYAGVKGDISKVPILDTDSGFPNFVIRNIKSDEIIPVEKGHKIDWAVEQPVINTRFGSHTPELCKYIDTCRCADC